MSTIAGCPAMLGKVYQSIGVPGLISILVLVLVLIYEYQYQYQY